jgi:hypothetical protein
MNTEIRRFAVILATTLLVNWPAPAQSGHEGGGMSQEFKGDCGKPLVVRTDGSQCPGFYPGGTNTCNQNSGATAITSCSTVMSFDEGFAGHVNTTSITGCGTPGHPDCTIDTGWFITMVECCSGGAFGVGITWGEVKMCCQVMPGQNPAFCDTPCGRGGGKGCASCEDPMEGQCINTFGPVMSDSCSTSDQGEVCSSGIQYWERIHIRDSENECR